MRTSHSSQIILIGGHSNYSKSGEARSIRPRNVSRTNTICCGVNAAKSRYVRVFGSLSLANTELAEHDIEQILDTDPAGDAAQRPHRLTQFFGGKLRRAGLRIAVERRARRLKRLTVARPGNQRRRLAAEATGDLHTKPCLERRHAGAGRH